MEISIEGIIIHGKINIEGKKKKNMEKAVVNVPDELIARILSRVPVRSLFQLRLACKYWYNLITAPSFIKLHHEHSNKLKADDISVLISNNIERKKKNMEKDVVDVPDELIMHILSRVQARSLFQLRRACKYWYNLITNDPSFIKLHHEHSKQLIADNISVLISDSQNNKLLVNHIHGVTVSSPIWEMKSLGCKIWGSSCNGLLCVQMLKLNVICLWNPCTDELRTIPNSLLKMEDDKDVISITYGLGYCPNIDDYKVIKKTVLQYVSSSGSLEIYSLRTNSWKTVYNRDDPYKYYYGWPCSVGLHLIGSLYLPEHYPLCNIVCFDIEKEEYRQLSVPIEGNVTHEMGFGELQGCLCIPIYMLDADDVEVWMTKDCGRTKDNWVKSFTIKNLMVNEIMYFNKLKPMKFNKNGEILLRHRKSSELFWYNPKSDKTRHVAEVPKLRTQAETFTGTLVSLN